MYQSYTLTFLARLLMVTALVWVWPTRSLAEDIDLPGTFKLISFKDKSVFSYVEKNNVVQSTSINSNMTFSGVLYFPLPSQMAFSDFDESCLTLNGTFNLIWTPEEHLDFKFIDNEKKLIINTCLFDGKKQAIIPQYAWFNGRKFLASITTIRITPPNKKSKNPQVIVKLSVEKQFKWKGGPENAPIQAGEAFLADRLILSEPQAILGNVTWNTSIYFASFGFPWGRTFILINAEQDTWLPTKVYRNPGNQREAAKVVMVGIP